MRTTEKSLEKLSEKRPWTDEQFKNSERLDRLHMHIIQPRMYVLRDTEMSYYNDLRRAFLVIDQARDQEDAIKLLREVFKDKYKKSMLYNLYHDIEGLFGEVAAGNAEWQRMEIQKRYYQLYDLTLEEGDYREARLALGDAQRNLPPREKVDDHGMPLELPDVYITSDERALTQFQEITDEEE